MDQIILGENCMYSTDSSTTGLNNNQIVVGTSGCGKTMSILEPALLENYERSLIVPVTKRRIIDMYAPLLRERGFEVWDLNLADLSACEIGFDPLRYVKTNEDIAFLAGAIIMGNARKERSTADPYFDGVACDMLKAEIAGVREKNPDATMADVLKLNDQLELRYNGGNITTTLDSFFNWMKPEGYAAQCWKSLSGLRAEKTASCVYSTLRQAVQEFCTPALREIMGRKKSVDFARLAREKIVLFITTSAVDPGMNYFINLFYSMAFKELFSLAQHSPQGRLPRPVHLMCDDFATGGRIPHFPEYISLMREMNISVTMLLQSENQLVTMYGEDQAVNIINNCDTYVYMGGMDLRTARNMSIRLNVPLDEVLYMPVSRLAVVRRGSRPVMTSRYRITEDVRYQEVKRQYEQAERSREQGGLVLLSAV